MNCLVEKFETLQSWIYILSKYNIYYYTYAHIFKTETGKNAHKKDPRFYAKI